MNAIASLDGRIDAVVIGTSAGGVDALSVLLPALPGSSKAAVFVVLHLPRDRPSLLVDIFAPKCRMAVREASDKEPVEAGTIYFAPPDYHLLIDAGPQLALSSDEPVNFSRPAIDVLFESAADEYGERLLGIVLTGGNQDGAAGLQAIRAAGGMTVVQEPETAHVRYMPELALQQGEVDYVLTLEQIAALLGTLQGKIKK
ncbi:chemotaxis protein CheB [Herbaspirillum hiltneri N3]|uniref:protein-glutamate methylesterase n=1 Tax=Herbaspirillum hiltneri N3 TaxID=1262470 RepID=A0ABM5UZ04_9BURK|nr:chemotaxis protein CheB [Herbaspirillum hiltneri]AKZ62576.1 chemotaxis protein CheB [Herbaspirillum hiltneri N3]